MNLNDALEYARKKQEEGHHSDGCTYAPDLNARPCCKMHDYLIRFKKVKRIEADRLLFKCMWERGHYIAAPIYWAAVRWVSITGAGPTLSLAMAAVVLALIALVKWG